MRQTPALLLALSLLVPLDGLARSAPADTTWAQRLQLGRAALRRDQRELARVHLARVDAEVGGHSGALLGLATLAARERARDEALRHLRTLAGSGLAIPIAHDTSFARWLAEPEFVAVVARLDSNAKAISPSSVLHELIDASLLAEDVAYDAKRARYLVSSIQQRRVLAVDARHGHITPFCAPGAGGLWGAYGLALDARRGLLWVSTSAGAECDSFAVADSGRTALMAFDLTSAKAVRRVELARTAERQMLGDLTLGPDGTVYASESLGGAVYALAPGSDTLTRLVAPGVFRSPQQPALSADGRLLYVADYSRGIGFVDLRSRATGYLPKPYDLASGGCDGLIRHGDRLIAVQNGTSPHRILELALSLDGRGITGWRVLEQASARMGEPTHGLVVGRDYVWLADSGWDRVGDDGRLSTPAGATAPVLMRLPLNP